MIGSDAEDELRRHNRELKKIDRFIRKKTRKNEFETAYLSCFPKILAVSYTHLDAMLQTKLTGVTIQ